MEHVKLALASHEVNLSVSRERSFVYIPSTEELHVQLMSAGPSHSRYRATRELSGLRSNKNTSSITLTTLHRGPQRSTGPQGTLGKLVFS